MTVKLYVGNLSHSARESDLENAFNNVGLVMSVSIPMDAQGKRKNYGIVNMGTADGAKAAIQSLDGSMLASARISVREAGPKD